MNIEQAKRIPMTLILEKIKEIIKEGNFNNTEFQYECSDPNDTLKFVSAYLKWCGNSCTENDAIRWINNMFVDNSDTFYHPEISEKLCSLRLKKVSELKHLGLLNYIKSKCIRVDVAKRFLCELKLFNKETGNTFSAIGFKNEEGGYEVRNKFYRGYLAPLDISFIRGALPKPDTIHLFENIVDYMSIVSLQNGKPFEADAIILNSICCLSLAIPYIKNYGYKTAFTWMKNNNEGLEITESLLVFFKSQNIILFTMNKLYRRYASPSDWYVSKHSADKV